MILVPAREHKILSDKMICSECQRNNEDIEASVRIKEVKSKDGFNVHSFLIKDGCIGRVVKI